MQSEKSQIDPARLTVDEASKLLSAAYRVTIPTDYIRRDIDSGAPVNRDGTINLINYAAWLLKELDDGH